MSSRRRGMDRDPFERDRGESLDRLDSELFGDLERVGRPVILRLDEIRTDGGTQPRAELNQDVIAEYAEAIQAGAIFPPVDVFYDGTHYWLADGFHRYHAHILAGKETIRAVVHQGDQRAAVLFSVGVNAEHGLRRTNEDKRRAVMTLLEDREWSQWSDREIARQAKVSNRFVGNLRKSLTVNGSQLERTYRTKHGTIAKMNIGGINADRDIDESGQDDPPATGDQLQDAQSGAESARTAANAGQAPSARQSGDRAEARDLARRIRERIAIHYAGMTGVNDATELHKLADLPAAERDKLKESVNKTRNLLSSEKWFYDQIAAMLERDK